MVFHTIELAFQAMGLKFSRSRAKGGEKSGKS